MPGSTDSPSGLKAHELAAFHELGVEFASRDVVWVRFLVSGAAPHRRFLLRRRQRS